ncbi:hypothetical protein BGZ65_003558 [Modicella reniformis]|uniref:EF-hand domain-containing protein n=1 Tax=Modicella reniformis TaxID=1440133 RepID=A0A9P6MBK1_9FUNG|nr:hypothetical protein BGZ65_003558 [Modicella reniformis]
MATFSADQINDFKELFNEHDSNGDGRVNIDELHKLIASLGVDTTKDVVDSAIQKFDADEVGALNFEEFVSLMAALREMD